MMPNRCEIKEFAGKGEIWYYTLKEVIDIIFKSYELIVSIIVPLLGPVQ